MDHYRLQAHDKTRWSKKESFFDHADHWTDGAASKHWQDADAALQAKEFYHVLQQYKNKLTPLQQLTFTMKYLDGEDAVSICKILEAV